MRVRMTTRQSLLVLASCVFAMTAEAIIIRHDVGPDRYEVYASEYPAVFFLERQGARKVCAATIIHKRWAITAAHCAEETMLGNTLDNGRRFAVEIGGRIREIDLMIEHPDYDQQAVTDVDLALLRFREPADLPHPIPLHLQNDELDAVVSIIGWGFFGLGTTGRQYDDGVLRLAQNRVTEAGARLRIVFDDPRDRFADSLELEGMPGLGDSGGPALLNLATGFHLAGIAVGEVEGVNFSEETQGSYGSIAVYERISRHIDWIETVIGSKVPFDS